MKTKVPPPDPAVGRAQEMASRIAEQSEARAAENDKYYREVFAPRYLQQMDDQLQLGREESARQREMSSYSLGLARKSEARMDDIYSEIERQSSEGEVNRRSESAMADVEQGIGAQRAATNRGLQRMGVNPGSGAYVAALAEQDSNMGLAKVMAANMARTAARNEGLNLRFQAAGLGTGATGGFLGQSSGIGMTGISALGSGTAGISAAQGGMGQANAMWQGSMNTGLNAAMGSANLGVQQQQMKFEANKANASAVNGMIGAAAGTMTGGSVFQGMISDRRLKRDIVLERVREDGLGEYTWTYVWGGARARGVMADEVRQVYPDAVVTINGFDVVDYAKLGAEHASV